RFVSYAVRLLTSVSFLLAFLLLLPTPLCSTLFPYTTLFRSLARASSAAGAREPGTSDLIAAATASTRARSAGARSVSGVAGCMRSEEHTSELQSHLNLVCRLLLAKKKTSRTASTQIPARLIH